MNGRDSFQGIIVEVESYGLEVSPKDKINIFKKTYRGRNANAIAREGSGLGLYLADVVAYANGFEVSHKQAGNSVTKNGQKYINNIFHFTIPK